jgi:hypothetical protein
MVVALVKQRLHSTFKVMHITSLEESTIWLGSAGISGWSLQVVAEYCVQPYDAEAAPRAVCL